jgi:hypothetical protein
VSLRQIGKTTYRQCRPARTFRSPEMSAGNSLTDQMARHGKEPRLSKRRGSGPETTQRRSSPQRRSAGASKSSWWG